jgi:hypothetical protein
MKRSRRRRGTRSPPTRERATGSRPRTLASGAAAGVVATLAFTLVHDLLISDIWEMGIAMSVVGGACGLCLAWSYGRLSIRPSVATWFAYNGAYIAAFSLLAVVSLLVYEPVTTTAAILERGGPIDHLIVRTLPMAVLFTLVASGAIALLFGPSPRAFGPILVTSVLLVAGLGLNVAPIGLVAFEGSAPLLVVELFVLVIVLASIFALGFLILEWGRFAAARPPDAGAHGRRGDGERKAHRPG